MPHDLKELYARYSSDSALDIVSLNNRNYQYIEMTGQDTEDYRLFSDEVNRLDLSINVVENLLMYADLEYEARGIFDFPIDMPREYFRLPDRNDPRDHFSFSEIQPDERALIDSIIKGSRTILKVRNDANIVRELLYRLEFNSLFAFFEAFLEAVYCRCVEPERNRLKSSAYMKSRNVADALTEIANAIEPEIMKILKTLYPDFVLRLHYCYLVRNIHTHNLGRINAFTLEKGMKYGSIEKTVTKRDGKDVEVHVADYYPYSSRELEIGRYVPLKGLVSLLRILCKESSLVLNKATQGD